LKKTLLTLAGATVLSMSAQAEQFWADNSVSVLNGSSYEDPFGGVNEEYTTMTLEHVSGHSWGGVFLFMDRHVGDEFKDTYFEVSPKFTLAKMDGVVSSINAAMTYESSKFEDNYLYGVGADLNIPGMNFASATVYRAFNEGDDDNQITLTYGFSAGDFNIDGYVDYSFDNDSGEDQLHINPQLTYNVAPLLGAASKVKVGIEYSNWTNKFGQDGKDQNALSLILKAHL